MPHVLVGHGDLLEAPEQLGRGSHMVGQALAIGRQLGVARERLAALPPARALTVADRGVGILAQGRGKRPLVTRLGLQAGNRCSAALLERPGERFMLGLRGGKRRPSGRKRTLRMIALLGRRGPALFGLDPRRFRIGERLGSGLGTCFRMLALPRLLASVAQRVKLLGELVAFLACAGELGACRFERRVGDPPFRAHRRLARKQFGERRLRLAR